MMKSILLFLVLTISTLSYALDIDYSLLNKPAPQFELPDISSSSEIKLSDYKGKLVLINFWASWCAPCRAELPNLVDLQKKYKEQNFTVIGLALEDKPFIKKFIKDQSLTLNFPITTGKTATNKIIKQYGNPDGLLPYSVLVSPKQEILAIYPGIISKTKMNRVLDRLLNRF